MNNYRKLDKGGNLFSAIEYQQAVAKREIGILKLRDIIDWECFRPLLEEICGYAGRNWSKGGQPPFDPVFMLKVLILQKYHGLSDDATENKSETVSVSLTSSKHHASATHESKTKRSSKASARKSSTSTQPLAGRRTVMRDGPKRTTKLTMATRITRK